MEQRGNVFVMADGTAYPVNGGIVGLEIWQEQLRLTEGADGWMPAYDCSGAELGYASPGALPLTHAYELTGFMIARWRAFLVQEITLAGREARARAQEATKEHQ